MAPVGSYESLMAAIQGGAGSVYFGVGNLNMRSRSSNNFDLDDLKKIAAIATEHDVNSYLTVNTIIFDNELNELRQVLQAAKEARISAVIASDIAVIQMAREIEIEVHISTQLNITNIEAVKFFAQFADVMVLAREMTLEKVADIHEQIIKQNIRGPKGELIQLEMFVHGALCMAISGKCYLSLHELNTSANRGSCMQVCRRGYKVEDKETGREFEIENEYIMSPKDLKTIHFLNKMLDAGITVLKIEGRARSPEYVKTVVSAYCDAVKAYQNNEFNEENISKWDEQLSTVFNRGFWDGYYLGQRLGEWSHNYGSMATTRKLYVGKGTNYFSKLKVAEFKIETTDINVGDKILITGPTTGVIETEIKEIRVNLESVSTAKKGEICSIPIPEKVRRADKLFKIIKSKPSKRRAIN